MHLYKVYAIITHINFPDKDATFRILIKSNSEWEAMKEVASYFENYTADDINPYKIKNISANLDDRYNAFLAGGILYEEDDEKFENIFMEDSNGN